MASAGRAGEDADKALRRLESLSGTTRPIEALRSAARAVYAYFIQRELWGWRHQTPSATTESPTSPVRWGTVLSPATATRGNRTVLLRFGAIHRYCRTIRDKLPSVAGAVWTSAARAHRNHRQTEGENRRQICAGASLNGQPWPIGAAGFLFGQDTRRIFVP